MKDPVAWPDELIDLAVAVPAGEPGGSGSPCHPGPGVKSIGSPWSAAVICPASLIPARKSHPLSATTYPADGDQVPTVSYNCVSGRAVTWERLLSPPELAKGK